MKKHNIAQKGKRALSMLLVALMVLSCWVWVDPQASIANAATITGDSSYLFAYFTGTSIEGQTIHLAVSQDGLNYTALRNNEPVIIPSKGTGNVRDPYLWYNENDGYYYILATDLDFTDKGSDYSDNSESFIVWRSKDLVNWYDETMIDVKAILGRLGVNNNNMQAVWAPQVLWDGSSFVVYFSLQCDATSNGSWNPLTIVYLRTTDLLDQSKYTEYGVIHNPGRHVIDADIIKKPGTNQYYMFYKDESASGGVQSIYYMVSDNGPTGPYYAPNNANDGRGPQLFSWVGKNLEGCNSFFDDNGNLITYVDEYDYTNASGQKEAHFHVSSSSDFTNYTKVDESSYNINSLSPRHGSVVKITDAQYNRLLEYSNEISSSSFPETENLSDHLVGRYFTTSDYTYNAANGKKDLALTNGTISTSTDVSGDYYAHFNAAGAQINLADLISGDLNIKDGFAITFSASAPTNLGSNARFFDISNNWSKRTDASECYLHMSPVANSNGLYVGAYNGPVTTASWTWASQGRNYNDGIMHDYIISFADGNMMLYIDGKLAMKRDRYNMNAEYGDNFLDDNWYKTIGNSVMRIGKSEWDTDDPLYTGSIQNLCIYDCSMSYYDVQKMQKIFDEQAGKSTVAKIVVPETVYMTPSTGASTTGQYYVNNTMHDGTNEVNLATSATETNGIIEFYIPGAEHFIVEVNTKTSGVGDIVLTEATDNTARYENVQYNANANGYFSYKTLDLIIDGTGIAAGKTALAEWKITVIMKDGSRTTHYAYSTLYAPWYLPVGAATRANASDGDLYDQSIAWVSGVHGYTANNSGSYWIAATNQTLSDEGEYNEKGTYYANTNMLPLISAVGTAGTTTAVKNWLSTSAVSGVSVPTIRYFSLNAKNSNYGCLVADISPVANITVDTSRYTNLNQIPNLKVGYNITDIESSKGVIWYVSDFTNIANTASAANGDGAKFYNYTKQDSSGNISNKAYGEWFDGGAEGSIIYGSATENCGSSYSAVSNGVEYDSAWNRSVVSEGTTYDYMFKGAAHAHRNSDRRTYSINYVQLRATNVDKTDLRNLVLKATYFNESDYTTDSWSAFKTALQNAAAALGNPTNSDIATAKTNLENAIAALQTTVTLNANGGTLNGSTKFNVTVGDNLTFTYDLSSYTPVRNGYVFKGWSTAADATDGASTVTAGLMPTMYAVWEEYSYNVAYNANGGVGSIEGVNKKLAESFDLPTSGFTKEGYTLIGWSTDKNATAAQYSLGQTVNGLSSTHGATVTLYAVWKGNEYTVTFDGKGGTPASTTKTVTFGSAYGELPTVARNGYSFGGWYNGSTPVAATDTVSIADNHTLTAKWTAKDYTITYVTDGGSLSANAPTGYNIETTVTIPSATKTGYIFDGWTVSNNSEWPAAVNAGDKISGKTGNVTLTAKWKANTFTITFDKNGGTGTMADQTANYGSAVILSANTFVREGYAFKGWNTKADGTGTNYADKASVTITDPLTNNAITLYAVWQITDAALVADEVAIDFYRPVAIDPVANDTILKTELNGKDYTLGLVGANERFDVDGKEITYHTTQNEGLTVPPETVTYTVTFDGITLKSTITVTLASNVYFEESALTTNAQGNLDWEAKGNPKISNVIDAETIDDIYGYNAAYDVVEDFSNGTYLQANVTSSAKKSDTAGFTFTGTGFDLIGACGYNTGVQTVKVQKKVDGAYKTIKLYVVDTYYKGDLIEDGDLLRQTPILTYRGEAGDYKVETTATYLNSATAIKQGTAYFSGTNGAVATTSAKPSKALVNELSSLGFDDTDNIEVVWMDDNSVFNGGTGSVNGSIFGGSAGKYFAEAGTTAGLANYVDGFRIYRDGGADYIESEQNPTYYNIIEGINNKNGTFDPITDNSLTAVFGENFDYNNYLNSNVPKGEIYLAKNQAVAFTFSADFSLGNFADVMLGMRVVKGAVNAKVTAKIDGNAAKTTTPSVISATEMYYDVSDAVQVSGTSGTVTIMVVNTGDGVLAVNNLKLVNGTLEANDSNLELPTGSNTVIGGTTGNATPVAPETETEVEDNTDNATDSITSLLPGMPASVASFLEMLFKLITQLLSSFGF